MTEAVVLSHRFVAGSTAGEVLALTVELRKGSGRGWGEVTNAAGARVPGLVEVPDRLEFSICGEVYDSRGRDLGGGQCVDALRRLLQEGWTPGPGLTRADLAQLPAVWERWHLNGMQAGCAHQRAAGWADRPIDPTKPTTAYGRHYPGQRSDSWNMLAWVTPAQHPDGLLTRPCPECGYPYGSAWLSEPLPAEVEAFVRDLARLPVSRGAGGQAEASAAADGIRLRVVGRAPANGDMEGDHWRVQLIGPGGKMSLTFTKGYGHEGKPPDLAEILRCVVSDAETLEGAASFEDWARDLGYSNDSRKAERIYAKVQAQTDKLKACLGPAYRRLVAS